MDDRIALVGLAVNVVGMMIGGMAASRSVRVLKPFLLGLIPGLLFTLVALLVGFAAGTSADSLLKAAGIFMGLFAKGSAGGPS